MVDFKTLKKNSKTDFAKLNTGLKALNDTGFEKDDDRYWNLTVDKAGNGYATIRFLRQVDGEDLPMVRYWDHGWKGPGGWYIEKSRTSLGKDEADPMGEYNTEQWNAGGQAGKDFVSGTLGNAGSKRRLHYVSNIYVINDPAKPENNGKVFLFKYGKKIYDKLNGMMNPKFADKARVNPFDFFEGATFNLRASKEDGFRSYNESTFEAPGPFGTDEEMEAVWKKCYPLLPIVDPSKFKSYDELSRKLQRVLYGTSLGKATVEQEGLTKQSKPERSMPERKIPTKDENPPWEEEDDTDLAVFEKLAQGS